MAAGNAGATDPGPPRAKAPRRLGAWQPFTWHGVAAFAGATPRRLLFFQGFTALASLGCVLWFLHSTWFPAVRDGIHHLPDNGRIERGIFISGNPSAPALSLVETRTLALSLAPTVKGSSTRTGDLRIAARLHGLDICSVLGCRTIPYPSGYVIQLSRPEVEAWWGAWEIVLYIGAGLGTFVSLFVSWWILATMYCVPVRIYAFFKDRRLNLSGSWKLSSAALLSPAWALNAAIVAYGLGMLDLVQLLVSWALHIPAAWLYLALATLRLPSTAEGVVPPETNPFGETLEPPSNPFSPGPSGTVRLPEETTEPRA